MKRLVFVLVASIISLGVTCRVEAVTPQIAVKSISNIAALRTLGTVAVTDGTQMVVNGFYTPDDGGSGTYMWASTSVAPDNGGTVIQPTGVSTGRWLLQVTGALSAKNFGAYGDGNHDDTSAMANAISASSNLQVPLNVPAGTYNLTASLPMSSDLAVYGAGIRLTTFNFSGNVDGFTANGASSIQRVILQNLRVVGNGSTGTGIKLYGVGRARLTNVESDSFAIGCQVDGTAQAANENEFYNCHFGANTGGIGMDLKSSSSNVAKIIGGDFNVSQGTGIKIEGNVLNTAIISVTIEGDTYTAIDYSGIGAVVTGCHFENVSGVGGTRTGILVRASGSVAFFCTNTYHPSLNVTIDTTAATNNRLVIVEPYIDTYTYQTDGILTQLSDATIASVRGKTPTDTVERMRLYLDRLEMGDGTNPRDIVVQRTGSGTATYLPASTSFQALQFINSLAGSNTPGSGAYVLRANGVSNFPWNLRQAASGDFVIDTFNNSSWAERWRCAQDGTITGQNVYQFAQNATINIKAASNAKAGTFTLSSGAATVSNTRITSASVVMFSLKTASGSITSAPYVSAVSAGTSFSVTAGAGDNSTYNYWIMDTY